MIVRLLAVGEVEALLVLLSLLLMLTSLNKGPSKNTFDGFKFPCVKPTSCNAFNPNNICTKIVPENGNNVWHPSEPINKQKGSWVPIHPNPTPDPEEDNSKKKNLFNSQN